MVTETQTTDAAAGSGKVSRDGTQNQNPSSKSTTDAVASGGAAPADANASGGSPRAASKRSADATDKHLPSGPASVQMGPRNMSKPMSYYREAEAEYE